MAKINRQLHENTVGYYHAYNRVAGKKIGYYPFEDATERAIFEAHLWRLSCFFAVNLGFFAFMGNHFHLLFEMLDPASISDAEIQARWKAHYASALADGRIQEPDWSQPAELAKVRKRIGSPSEFLHDLKGQFAEGYNVRHDLRGSFWDGRFKNTLLSPEAVASCGRYIELNPLRARIECKVGAAARNSWHNFEQSCSGKECDFRKHIGFQLLIKALHPHPDKPLTPGEELELAIKTYAAWREHFDAEEKRLAEERVAAALAKEEQRATELTQSRQRSWFDALVVGSLEYCRRQAIRMHRSDTEPIELAPGLYGLFRRQRRSS